MEEILGLVSVGILVGLMVIYFLSELDRKQYNISLKNKNGELSRLQHQRDEIIKELQLKVSEKTKIKEDAVALTYQFAASKNLFTLKDVEVATKQIQNYYKSALESNSTFKMNFPEKELLSFEPRETLSILTIINEGLHNAALYSNANYIFNIASIEDGNLNLITHDNGMGYDRNLVPNGDGIQTLRKVTQKLNGVLELTSTIGNGTVVNAQIPIDRF